MRTRTMTPVHSSLSPGSEYTQSLYHSYNGLGGTFTEGPVTYDGLTETWYKSYKTGSMTDTVTPNFKKLRDQGAIINNAMTQDSITYTGADTYVNAHCIWEESPGVRWYAEHTCSGRISPFTLGLAAEYARPIVSPVGDHGWASDDDDSLSEEIQIRETTSAAYAKMADAPLSAWVFVGEFNETVETIVWILKKIRFLLNLLHVRTGKKRRNELLRRIRSGKLIGWSDFEELSNAYLQVRYGIRPLLYDLHGALKVLEDLGQETRQRFGVKTDDRVWDTLSPVTYSTVLYPGTTKSPGIEFSTYGVATSACRAGLLAHPVFDEANLLTLLGAGEIVKGTWDLVPYSFVIDWLFNTADVFSAWSPNAFIQVLASWCVLEKSITYNHDVLTGPLNYDTMYYTSPQSENEAVVQAGYARVVTKSLRRIPDPPRAIIPTFDLNLDILKAVDLLALSQHFGKFRRGV